jgi:hypothetical protein
MRHAALRDRRRVLYAVGLVLSLGGILAPAPAGATKYAGAFMEDGGGARALAMGSAFVAVASDPSTVFWNAAGLAGLQDRQVLLMHAERFGDLIDRDFAAYTQPVGWSLLGGQQAGVGLSIIRLGVDDIPLTDHLFDQLDVDHNGVVDDTEILGLFDLRDQIRYRSDQEWAFFLSYGERKGNWQVGGSLKVIRQSIDKYSSLGIGLDLALLRPRIWRGIDFGVKFQDITTTYLSWDTPSGKNEIIAPAIVPGLARTFDLPQWNSSVLVACSLENRFENRRGADQFFSGAWSANGHLGVEVAFNRVVFLRGGFNSGFNNENLTGGAGFRINPLTVDYAYAGKGEEMFIDESTHRISLSVRF